MGQMMGNIGDKNVMDPRQAKWGDLDNSEKRARMTGMGLSALGGGLQGLGQQQRPQGGAGPMPMLPQAPQYDFSQIANAAGRRPRSPFYGE